MKLTNNLLHKFVSKSQIKIVTANKVNEKFNSRMARHSHDFWQMEYIIKGELIYFVSGKRIDLKEADCLLLPPGAEHSLENRGGYVSAYNLKYYFSDQKKVIGDTPCLTHLGNLRYHFEEVFSSLIFELRMKYPDYENIYSLKVYELLIALQRAHKMTKKGADKSEEYYPSVDKSLMFIKENFDREINIGKIVEISGASRAKLYSEFKKITGYSPFDYIIRLRIEKAKELMQGMGLNIKQISNRVGYENVFYFSRLFKKFQGLAPSEYMKKLKT